MAAREVLMICVESSYGTAKATPVLGTDKFYMRLDKDNAFGVEAEPVQLAISYGGGVAIEADTVSDVVETQGSFDFLLYPGISSQILLNWAITRVNTGRTTPWTTTDAGGVMPVGDLASLSFYHAILQEDGATYTRTRYAGAKCLDWQVTASETGDGRMFRLSGTMSCIRPVGNAWDSSSDPDATEFPLPAETDYPFGPFTLGHLATGSGVVTLGASAGTDRKASLARLLVKGTNHVDTRYYTSRFPVTARFTGRSVTAEADMRYKVSPNDKTSWRALTAQTVNIIIDNAAHAVTFALNGNNLIRPWKRELANDKEYMQSLTYANRFSPSAAADMSVTVT